MFFNNERDKCLSILGGLGLNTHSNSYWYVQNSRRAVDEFYKMMENTNAVLSQLDDSITWTESIVTNLGNRFLIKMVVCSNFPYAMPEVFVLDPTVSFNEAIHIYPDGHLCLMHPDVYRSSMSLLQIRNLACSWCECYALYQLTREWPGAEHQH